MRPYSRDHEYRRHGALSLLAGIDLLTGKVHALVEERHRSREFIEFLKVLDAAYPASTTIKIIHPYVQGNQSLVRDTAGGPLRIYLHSEAWLVAIGPSRCQRRSKRRPPGRRKNRPICGMAYCFSAAYRVTL